MRLSVDEIAALIEKFRGLRVACVGDLVLDRFVYGSSDRVSREAPVPALDERRRTANLGAAGNVARNVAALGGIPILCATVGDDPEGHEVSAALANEEFGDVELVTAARRATPTKTRYVANNQQMLCVNRDPHGAIGPEVEEGFIRAALAAIESAQAVILSDYGRGAVTPRVARAVIDASNAAGVKVVTDPRGRDFTRYDGSYIVKPNAQELGEEAGFIIEDDADSARALAQVAQRLPGVAHLLVTRGARGVGRLSRGESEVVWCASAVRDVYDVSGAGDTTIAALGLGVAAGADIDAAIDVANRAAGVVVTKIGTAVVRGREVIEDARSQTGASASMATLEQATEEVARWRAKGRRIGLTNGCFDVLHVGHLTSLERARAACDRLVVAINSDASVRRLKGEGRPINSAVDRARMIAALSPVDLVVEFDDDTAIKVVEALQPEVYVKGGDYTPDALPEAASVRAYNGEILITSLEPGKSTTDTLKKLSRPNDPEASAS